MERILQNEMSDKLNIAKHLGKSREYQTKIRKLLKAIDKSLRALPAQPVLQQARSVNSSSSLFSKRSILSLTSETPRKHPEIERQRSHEKDKKRVEEEKKEIDIFASFVSSKFKVSRSSIFSHTSTKYNDEEEEHRPRSKKNNVPKTTTVGQRTIRQLRGTSGTHRNNPRSWRRRGTSRRKSRSKSSSLSTV